MNLVPPAPDQPQPPAEPGPVTRAFEQVTDGATGPEPNAAVQSYASRNPAVFSEAMMLAQSISMDPHTERVIPEMANAFLVGYLTGVMTRHGGTAPRTVPNPLWTPGG